jgi:carbon-monoxide dehydrogenase large subunit
MAVEGIGARALRKEDKRFITGKGRYTDDMTMPGMGYAAFVRSPHAHAKVANIDAEAALAMPGVDAVLTGDQLIGDGIGNLICGWMIHSKDGTPMNMGGWRALAGPCATSVRRLPLSSPTRKAQARDAADAVVVDYEELPTWSRPPLALKPGAPQLHPEAEGNLIFDWEIGDEAATDAAFASAAHVTKMEIHQQPSGAQPDGAARGACPL